MRDMEFRNQLLDVIYDARGSAAQTLYFAAILDEMLEDLDAELEG